jgi:hypothetical protein
MVYQSKPPCRTSSAGGLSEGAGWIAGSQDGPTRVVALIPLSTFSDTAAVRDALLQSADAGSLETQVIYRLLML